MHYSHSDAWMMVMVLVGLSWLPVGEKKILPIYHFSLSYFIFIFILVRTYYNLLTKACPPCSQPTSLTNITPFSLSSHLSCH